MDTPTPRVELLVSRLVSLNNDLAKNMNQLVKRLGYLDHPEILVLSAATENIIDRKKDKARHLKSWKVEVYEIINTPIEFEQL